MHGLDHINGVSVSWSVTVHPHIGYVRCMHEETDVGRECTNKMVTACQIAIMELTLCKPVFWLLVQWFLLTIFITNVSVIWIELWRFVEDFRIIKRQDDSFLNLTLKGQQLLLKFRPPIGPLDIFHVLRQWKMDLLRSKLIHSTKMKAEQWFGLNFI